MSMSSKARKNEAKKILAACGSPEAAGDCYECLARDARSNGWAGGAFRDELECARAACALSC
jgi:hypothetical protein